MCALVVEGGRPGIQGDEVRGTDEGPRAELRLQAANRAERQHPVAAGLSQRAHVGRVIDPVWEHVAVGAVALQIDGIRQEKVESPDSAPAADRQPGHDR